MDLPARTPRKTPLKTELIKAKRLQFAHDHANWSMEDWKQVVFSDETWIQVRENGRIQFVRRCVGEAYNPAYVVTTTKFPVKVMMFGAISHEVKSDILFINGTINVAKYQEVLAEAGIKQFLRRPPHPSVEFMEDGAPAHRAKSTK